MGYEPVSMEHYKYGYSQPVDFQHITKIVLQIISVYWCQKHQKSLVFAS